MLKFQKVNTEFWGKATNTNLNLPINFLLQQLFKEWLNTHTHTLQALQ